MERYMVIATINGKDFMCSVDATSAYAAEHVILDLGICGKHKYGVEACMAFDKDSVKTDTFIGAMLSANTVSWAEIVDIIDERNAEIHASDEAEARIAEIDKLVEEHKKEIALLTAERNAKQMLIEK